jgi:long-chain fatty acid transport protein
MAPRAAAKRTEEMTAMTKTLDLNRIALAIAGLAISTAGVDAFGAGFQLNETSASGLGNAFAGGAAVAEDAATVWANPAGMSRLTTGQVVGVIHLIRPSMKFVDEGSSAAASQTLGGNGGDAGSLNVVPNLYFVMPINAQWSAGVGLNSPWGLVTEYDDGWIGRFQAMKSSIKTYNIGPAVSWKASNSVSLGLGVDFQRLEAEFTNQVNYGGALAGGALNLLKAGAIDMPTLGQIVNSTAGLESSAKIKGSDNGTGWNVGVLWNIDPNSRIGIHYRSRISYHLSGDATFANPTLPALPPQMALVVGPLNKALTNTAISSDIKIPEIVNLSYFRTLDPRWDVMLDARWTGWSSIQSLTIVRSDGTVLQSTPENFKNTWKFALGANYHPNSAWTWRGGLAYDQSPVQDEYRTPRLPDADRTWFAGGGQYKTSQTFKFDFGAAYLYIKNTSINANGGDPTGQTYGVIKGHYDSSTWIVSAQGTWSF